ncbi:RHS repeat-associated core domain-containing protein [Dyella sp. GSA-30]|uniref:RHS repeat-associated core domain-containing protein n=1 Tax=Dyella sp. GSA-30 TaxID=2994496 RepID=UPI0024904ACC|nr:RHS repeat-associated core domain-containing protein [Dyella sp. GSA-30]BDU22217.1 hypothetical protein DYGSA30_36740 [Dyella sp. GSA-30]
MSGTQIWQWPYQGNPFGEKPPTASSGYTFNLRYSGQYFDVERGVTYNINRDYDAQMGRYLQSDLIGVAGGESTYGYVGSKPLSYSDNFGLEPNPLELTCVEPLQPVCWTGLAIDAATWVAGGTIKGVRIIFLGPKK